MSNMITNLKSIIKLSLNKFGYEIHRLPASLRSPHDDAYQFPLDFDEMDKKLWKTVSPYTMTSPERIFSLRRAVEYVVASRIPGALVECGVWKGGSAMAIALTLMRINSMDRDIYLYDTFDEGWPEGGELDITVDGIPAHQLWLDALERGETPDTLFAKLNNVRDVIYSSGYPKEKLHLVKGKVEDTIPGQIPDRIALLRLDTDWYSSTKHELVYLYPRLTSGGVIMIDDYGSFMGARQATDEYLKEHGITILLHRVDDGGYRIGIKP